MNTLISIGSHAIGPDAVQTVNARELHAFLEVGKDFSTWLKDRTEQYGFKENSDFVCSPNLGSDGRGGHNRKDYHLTLDMAKELAMVERNEKGKQARQYFIECERKAKNPSLALTRMDLIKMALDSEQRALELEAEKLMLTADKVALEAKTAAQAPKVAALDRIATSDGGTCITNAAKDLQIRPKDLFRWLQANGWIYRRQGGQGFVAYQGRIQQGYLEHKVTTVERSDGSSKTVEQVLVTPRGLARLAELLSSQRAA